MGVFITLLDMCIFKSVNKTRRLPKLGQRHGCALLTSRCPRQDPSTDDVPARLGTQGHCCSDNSSSQPSVHFLLNQSFIISILFHVFFKFYKSPKRFE